jgi:hypothetical protein
MDINNNYMVAICPNNYEQRLEKIFPDIASKSALPKILLVSTQLGANYEMWANDENITSIMDMDKNRLCKWVKFNNQYLDDKSVKCIVMSIYIYMHIEILNIMNLMASK